MAIARAVRDAPAIAAALHALTVVVWDPHRRAEHRAWTDELMNLGATYPGEPWGRWAAPVLARSLAIDGDVVGATTVLDRLAVDAAVSRDAGAAYAASYAAMLRASVLGDWSAAGDAVVELTRTAHAAGFDSAGTAMQQAGLSGIIELLRGPADVASLPPIEWPSLALELAFTAWHANCSARAGQIDSASKTLARIDPASLATVERDGYWMATLSMLADATHLTGCAPIADAAFDHLAPLIGLTILDPGMTYRGSVAHAAGLAAATCQRRLEAADLLAVGLAEHERQGSPWMAARSRDALAAIARW